MTVKEVRDKLKLSNKELADKLCVSEKTVESYITGNTRSIERAHPAVQRIFEGLQNEAKAGL